MSRIGYRIAREVTDEVMGPGTYGQLHKDNPHPIIREEARLSMSTEAEGIDPHEHIHPDDPRYAGFRINEYWMATALAPDDQEAPLLVEPQMGADFHLPPGPAMAADERRLIHLREFAAWSAQVHDCEVRIRHFVPEGEPEVFTA
jgi:hypothetical protein